MSPFETPKHDHDDPTTKNAISRAGEVSAETQDPTTPAERRANAAYVAADRTSPEPTLTRAPVGPPRPKNQQPLSPVLRTLLSLA